MLPWSFSEGGAAEKHMPQLQHNMWVTNGLLALPEPRRFRDKTHVKFVSKQPCLICGRRPADAHHLRFAQHPALGRKVSDEFIVPLCRGHHREVHRSGDEASWWSKGGIDPIDSARTLWTETHPLRPVAEGPNLDQATTSRAPTSDSTSVPGLRTRNRKWSQLLPLALNDFLQADRGQPSQCLQRHWPHYGRRQAAVALQCGPSRAHGRDGDRRA